ncbi:MAG: hypothetical protein ACLFRG_17715 [Desulfococcaceae bacterium]
MTDAAARDDHDSPWKEVLELYFPEFIAFFSPEAHREIDWSRGYEFLDKELQQITRDAETGRRYVDKLARVWLKNGAEEWALIHSDIQMFRETDFDERMYIYHFRLYDRYRRHAASFAVIGGEGRWRPGLFERKLWNCETRFRFPVVRLLDFEDDLEALRNSDNPFATVVLAYLHTRRTKGDNPGRRREKMALIRHLHEKNYSRQDIINLFRFIDWSMRLPQPEEQAFWRELAEYEEEKRMPYITSVEKIGYQRGMEEGVQIGEEKGMEKGMEKGKNAGEAGMQARILAKKFGLNPENLMRLIQVLGPEERAELADAFWDLESPEALMEWIKQRAKDKKER